MFEFACILLYYTILSSYHIIISLCIMHYHIIICIIILLYHYALCMGPEILVMHIALNEIPSNPPFGQDYDLH